MKPKLPKLLAATALTATILSLPASATDYYWDNNGATAGFGTAAGTWAEPTVGDATQGFSTDIAGTTLPVDVTTIGTDIALFGTDANGLGAGTINVSGTVSAQRVDFRAASGAITLTGGTINLTNDVVSRATGMTVDSEIAISGSARFIKARNTGMTTTIGGEISGTGDVTFTNSGTLNNPDHAYALNGNSTYTGNTLIDGGGSTNSRLRVGLGVNDALPVTTVLTIDGRNGTGSGRDTRLDLNGFNQTIAGLTNVVRNSLRRQDVRGPGTLTIDNTSNYTFSGRLTGALNLVKAGSGTQTLSGANTYSGTTTVTGGALRIGNAAGLGTTSEINLGDGAQLIPDLDGLTVTAPITLGTAGTISTISAPTSGSTGGLVQTLTLNSVISGDGDLIFAANNSDNTFGTIVLGAANDYTGATRIDNPNSLFGANCFVKNGTTNALPATTVLTLDGFQGIGSGRRVVYDLDGFDQTLSGLTNVPRFDRKQWVTTSSPATLTINNADDFTFGEEGGGDGDADIRDAISLVKSGAGTFTLATSQTYTGTTTITEGTLQGEVGGGLANSSVVSLEATGTYGVLVSDNAQSWTSSALTTTGAGTLLFNFGATFPSASVSPMSISGAADFSAATPLVSVLVDSGLPPGTYPLATWGSLAGTAPTTTELTVSTLAPGTDANLNLSGNTLELVISDTSVDVAKGDNIDDLNLDTSWASGTAPGAADTAVWDNTVLGANTVSLGADLTWGTISILDPGGPVTINAGNTLTLIGDPTGLLSLIDMSSATQDLTLNANLIMENFGFWDVASGRTLTVAGAISGDFGPTKLGDGTAVLSGANTYTGATSVAGGTLQLGADDVIPNGIGSSNVSLLGTLDLNGFSDTINGLGGSGNVDNTAGSTTSTLTVGDDDQPSTFGGILQNTGGTLGLTKIGSGTLTLEGANTLSGPIDVQDGILAFTNTSPFDNASSLTLAGGTSLRPGVVGATVFAPITVGATGTDATITGPTVNVGGNTFTLDGGIFGDGNVIFDSRGPTNADSKIVLNGASTYAGSTRLTCTISTNSRLIVRLGTDNALPATTVLTIDCGDGAGGGRQSELDLNGNNQTLAGLTSVVGSNRVQRVVNDSATPATLTINNTANYSFAEELGRSSDGANFGLTKSGTGIFTASGTLFYTGDTTVNAGILSLGAANPNNDASTVTIADSGATLNLNFSGTDTVDKLFVGTTQLASGEYKAPGSAATGTELVQLSGTGTLTVTTGPVAGFDSWASTNGAAGGFDDDHDGDGVKNGVEFFIGGPTGNTTGPTALPTVVDDAGTLSVTWTKSADYLGVYGTDYWVETSATLSAPWTMQDADPDLGFTVTFPSATEVKFTFPAGTKDFARLSVTRP